MPKHSARRGKYPKRVVTVSDPATRDAFYAATDPIALIEQAQVACGLIQHPESGYWQLWVSTNGHDFTCLSAQREQEAALRDLNDFKALVTRPGPPDQKAIDALLEALRAHSSEPPRSLTDDMVRQLSRDIRSTAHRPKIK